MIVVVFLFPLAVYCLALGLVNRRRRPLMVSAVWDFAGLLFAASGFLAFGLPGLLSGFTEHGRRLALFGRPSSAGGAGSWLWDQFEGLCSTLYAAGGGTVLLAYFAVVVLGCAYLLWRRRDETAIYNVHPGVLEEVLAAVLEAGGLTWSRAGNRYFIGRADKPRRPTSAEGTESDPPTSILRPEHLAPEPKRGAYPTSAEEVERSAYLEVDPAPALYHVTLRWEAGDAEVRELVEAELRRALAEVRTRHNPTGPWLLTIGSVLLTASVMVFASVVFYRIWYGV